MVDKDVVLTSAKAGAVTSAPLIVTSSVAPRDDPSAFARNAVRMYVPFARDGKTNFPSASVVVLAAITDGSVSRAAVIVTPTTELSGAAFELVTLPLTTADAGGGGFDNSGNNISMRP